MARRKDDRGRPAAHAAAGGAAATVGPPRAAGESIAGGPRAFTVDEEALADGRYIIYYAWPTADEATAPAPARRPASRAR